MKADFRLASNVLHFPTMPRKRDFEPTNRIRALRLAAGKTLQELATPLNSTPAQIQRLETGERELTLHWMQRLATVLDCQPADLLLPVDGGLDSKERRLVDTVREVPPASSAAIFGVMESVQPYRQEPGVIELLPKKTA